MHYFYNITVLWTGRKIAKTFTILKSRSTPCPFMRIYWPLVTENQHFQQITSNSMCSNTYRISSSANPRNACSSKHVISLLSTCRLRNDVAPLNVFRPMICNELCDRSLNRNIEWKNTQNKKLVQSSNMISTKKL